MVVTTEVRDKSTPEIWHGKHEIGQLGTADELQVKQRPTSEIENREGQDVKSPLCLGSRKPNVRNGMY